MIVYVKTVDIALIDQTELDKQFASVTKKILAKITTPH